MRYQSPTPGTQHRDLDQLRRQARDLRRAFLAGHPDAVALVHLHYHDADPAAFALSDAQLVIARFHGCESWPKLKAQVDTVRVGTLAEAVTDGDVPRVRALLRRRPELVGLDLAPNDERRALHLAVLARNLELVRLLMRAGADARKGVYPHRDATTPLTFARERGFHEIVTAIEEEEARRGKAVSSPASRSAEILFDAIAKGRDEVAISLLCEGESLIRIADRNGATPLHAAAAALNEPVIDWLLSHRADVDARNRRGCTPLECAVLAVYWRRPDTLARFGPVARRLRTAGAELSLLSAVALGEGEWLRSALRESPLAGRALPTPALEGDLLSLAIKHERGDMLRVLLDLGFDPDETAQVEGLDQELITRGMPLWHAAASGKYDMAELLLDRGADPNASVYASGTPFIQALARRDERMIELLRAHGGRPNAATAGLHRMTALAREYLAGRGPILPTPEAAGAEGVRELLWGAACGGDPEIVGMCLERIDWPREDPRWFGILDQPLRIWNHGPGHWVHHGEAALDRSSYPECFRLILQRCDPNVPGRFGRRMLHAVAALGITWGQPVMTEEERVCFAEMLLDAGAGLDYRDDLLRSTPLGWAVRWGRLELTRLLLQRGAPIHEPDAEPWATPQAWAVTMGWQDIAALLR